MCGSTGAQNQLQQEQIQFYQQGQQEAAQTYAEDQELLGEFQSVYDPILKAGPNQEGFSDAEKQTLDAGAVEGTAQNYAHASKAVNEQLASEGGGDIPLSTGGKAQLKSEVANASAQQESAEEQQIKEADFQQGHQNFEEATNALATVSGQLNPTAFENAATSGGSAASNTANEIAEENNSWENAAIGAVAGIGGDLVSENPGNIFG